MDVDSSSPISSAPEATPPPSERPYSTLPISAAAGSNNNNNNDSSSSLYAKPAEAVKKPRKKREPAAENGEVKKAPRKPREPRDPSKPVRKKVKTEATTSAMTENPTTVPPSQYSNGTSATPSVHSIQPDAVASTAIQAPRPSSSGQRYDPIRSASAENALNRHPHGVPPPPATSPQNNSRTSIANLIGPTSTYSNNTSPLKQPTSHPQSNLSTEYKPQSTSTTIVPPVSSSTSGPSVVVQSSLHATAAPSDNAVAPSATRSDPNEKAPSPKPPRQKESLPPVPLGIGLLSNSVLGKPDAAPRELVEVPNDCIIIEMPLNKPDGNYVNFIKEVENKYGFDVAHPRLAEHRRRMKEIAAAGAALESGQVSGDEMAVDESEDSTDAEMKPPGDESATADGTVKKRRKRREQDYDKNDDFIDDTETMWEEQALAVKEGFFVWSGPLIPEGDKPSVEKADGTVSKRGGRGSRGGRGGTTRGESSGRGSRGGGRGSRGGTTVRKPRITKADRARMETEKQERERMAMTATRPSNYPSVMIQ